MKIDLDLIEKMVTAGASGAVILAYLRDVDAKQAPKLAKERTRKNAENARKRTGKSAENQRQTLDDSPRARLFREGGGILAALGRPDRAARALLAQWLKLTNDDAQLVMATLQRARDLGVADVAGWVLTTLNGKVNPNGTGHRGGGKGSPASDFFAGIAQVAADIGGDDPVAGRSDQDVPRGRVEIEH